MPIDFSEKIDEVDEISFEEFQEKYFIPQKPVKLKKFLKDSPALNKWNLEFFKERMGNVEVGVFDDGVEILDRPNNIPIDKMKFGDYLDLIASGPTKIRLFAFNIFKADPSLKKDLIVPKLVNKVLPINNLAFFGGESSITRLHRDADNSNLFLSEFYGEKLIVLFEPKYDDLLYRYPYTIHSGIDIENPDYEKYPGLHHVKGKHLILKKGETLFMPPKYWHYIRYLSPGIGLNFRSLGDLPNTLEGLNHVTLTMQFDHLMRKIAGDKWFQYKTKKAEEAAQKAILQFQ
jgi:hypothetical protein